jgi:APA family basic amino acid/polyamine antiporter
MASTPTSPVYEGAAATTELRRQLGLASATAAVAGEAIAVGIFLTPAGMARSLGSPFWLLVVWLSVGAATLSGALCFGELARRFPRAGGQYVYLQAIFGKRTAFLFGWMSLLVLDPGLAAALSTGLGAYAGYAFQWSPQIQKLAAVAAIWGICVLNILSLRLSAGFLRWITWVKFGTLTSLMIWAIAFGLGSWSNFIPFVQQRSGSLPLIPALGAAVVGAFFSFGGWWDVSKIAGEIRDPRRTLPRAMVLGVTFVTAVYILVSGVFVYLVPMDAVTSDETFVAQAGETLAGRAGGVVLAIIVSVCILGSVAAFVMTVPRVYYAMARDGLFLQRVGRVHPRFGTPVAAIAIQGGMATVLIGLGTFEQIISYFMFPAVAFLGLTVAGLFVLPNRTNPLLPGAFLILIAIMLGLVGLRNPGQAALGVLIVLAGAPVYSVVARRE